MGKKSRKGKGAASSSNSAGHEEADSHAEPNGTQEIIHEEKEAKKEEVKEEIKEEVKEAKKEEVKEEIKEEEAKEEEEKKEEFNGGSIEPSSESIEIPPSSPSPPSPSTSSPPSFASTSSPSSASTASASASAATPSATASTSTTPSTSSSTPSAPLTSETTFSAPSATSGPSSSSSSSSSSPSPASDPSLPKKKSVVPPKKPVSPSSSPSSPSSLNALQKILRAMAANRLVKLIWSIVVMCALLVTRPRPIKYFVKTQLLFSHLFLSCLYGVFRGVLYPSDRRNLNYHASQFFAKITPLLEINHTIEGAEHLENQPCVYVLNHQSTLDLLSVAHIMPMNTAIVGKKSLVYVPILGWFIMMAHNVLIDRQNHESAMRTMEKVGMELREKKSGVIVFPEGTRSRSDGTLLPFKKGSFNLAVGGQVPIVPVVISNQKSVYNSKQWSFPGGDIKVKVLPPVPTTGLTREDVPALAEKIRELMAKELMAKELNNSASA